MNDATLGYAAGWRVVRAAPAGRGGGFPGGRRAVRGAGRPLGILATRWTAGRCQPIDFLQERQLTTR
jgi:hypothetical protein